MEQCTLYMISAIGAVIAALGAVTAAIGSWRSAKASEKANWAQIVIQLTDAYSSPQMMQVKLGNLMRIEECTLTISTKSG